MARKIIPLITDEIYHIILRGVEGRVIFQNEEDYYRAIHDLYEFNDEDNVSWIYRHAFKDNQAKTDILEKADNKKQRKLLVHILAFCLMPNHLHFLLKQIKDKGISKFMQKFGSGYAVYFNNKYHRQGALFQSRFKPVLIENEEQLKNNFVYIHSNPVALIEPNWKIGGIKDLKRAIKAVENYKWSSYQDYLSYKNFPSLTHRGLFEKMLQPNERRSFVNDWLKHKKEDF